MDNLCLMPEITKSFNNAICYDAQDDTLQRINRVSIPSIYSEFSTVGDHFSWYNLNHRNSWLFHKSNEPALLDIKIEIRDLLSLQQEIDESRSILELSEDWDGDGALPIKDQLYNQAISFLKNIAFSILKLNNYSYLAVPEINPCPDGTIDFSWRTQNARLLINIKEINKEYLASYYGDINGSFPFKGSFDPTITQDHIAAWINQNLK